MGFVFTIDVKYRQAWQTAGPDISTAITRPDLPPLLPTVPRYTLLHLNTEESGLPRVTCSLVLPLVYRSKHRDPASHLASQTVHRS